MKQTTVIDSAYGPLTLVADDGVLCGLYMTDQRHRPPQENFGERDDRPFGEAIDQLNAYFAGELKDFTLPLSLHGTQKNSWTRLTRTAAEGSNTIEVLNAAGWKKGDAIVVASTDFDPHHAERRTISRISGNMITLDQKLLNTMPPMATPTCERSEWAVSVSRPR